MVYDTGAGVVDLAKIWAVGPVENRESEGEFFFIVKGVSNSQFEIKDDQERLLNGVRTELVREWRHFKQGQNKSAS
ncbi:MAG: hypothetical protein ACKV1O_13055 [Saprospiraceae bacterium]